ncbi:MAG: hypothetical protein AB1758_18520 [Candidatus Eremiobacterota bacterium]
MDAQDMARLIDELREYRVGGLPGYASWASARQEVHPEILAHLSGMITLLHPTEEAGPHDELFQELYQELLADFGLDEGEEATFDLPD